MKIFICLLVLACACNAEVLNNNYNHITYNAALAAGGGGDYGHGGGNINYVNNHGVSYTHGYDYPQNYVQDYGGSSQVILDHSSAGHGTSGIQSYEGSYASGHNNGYGAPTGGEVQVFKVITESAPAPAPTALSHSSNFYDVESQLNSILPQLLQVILQDGFGGGGKSSGSGSNSYLNSLLITHFGRKGEAVIKRSHKKSANDYFSGGHVIEKGVLKITSVKREPRVAHSGPIHGHASSRSLVYGW